MSRSAFTLVLAIALATAPVVAFGDPSEGLTSEELAFMEALPTIFEGWCIGGESEGRVQHLPCEIRAEKSRLWPQEFYYLIVFTADGQEVLGISTFSVEGERVLYSSYEK